MESSSIPGRGGATLVHIASDDDTHTLMLIFGASREQQFDDFWTITIDRKLYKVSSVKKLELKERDNFTTRNSMTAVVHKGKIICFGG